MLTKILIAIGIAITIAFTTYFVVTQNMILAALSIIGMFTLTNLLRAIAFKDRNMHREAKWMQILSIICVVAFVALAIFALLT